VHVSSSALLPPERIASELSVPERVLLLCVASTTDWTKVGITGATAQTLMVKDLIERDRTTTRFVLTKLGRSALAVLLERAEIKLAPLN
jgi:hypothetical protein